MLFQILLLVILISVVAALHRDGLWSNAIALFNVVTAGVLATNFFEPATKSLSDGVPMMDYNWDVIVLGGLFCVIYLVLRTVGLLVSKFRVQFHPLLDQIGSVVLAVWVGWVAVCFITFMLHTSPLAKEFLKGGFQAEKKMFFGFAPDRQWLAFVTKLSDGGGWGTNATDPAGNVTSVFDPKTEFMMKYGSRRAYLEKHPSPFAGVVPEEK